MYCCLEHTKVGSYQGATDGKTLEKQFDLRSDLHNYFLLWQNEIFFGFGQVKRPFQNKIFFGFCFGFAKAKDNCTGQPKIKAKVSLPERKTIRKVEIG